MSLDDVIEVNRAATLGRYFRRVVATSIAAAAIGLSGCTSVHGVDPTGFDGPVCVEGVHQVVNGLMTPSEWDYVGAFQPIEFRGGDVDGSIVHARGELCGAAVEREACETEANRGGFSERLIVVTRGDTVERFQTHAEVMEFLGEVDTAQEALLVAWHSGYNMGCGDVARGGVREVEGGYEVIATRLTNDCPFELTQYLLSISSTGSVDILAAEIIDSSSACAGRRPDAWVKQGAIGHSSPVANYLASMAHLEAGAVLAFENLVRELVVHGAPEELIRDAERAVQDEIAHAEVMGDLAAAYGATPPAADVTMVRVRSLYEMALDNATEGCVRETYGALMGTYQAGAAQDRDVALAMRTIAEDETRHASLSWRIGDWLMRQLSEEERSRVLTAQREAVITLRAAVSIEPSPELHDAVGLPPAQVALAMVDQLAADIWH